MVWIYDQGNDQNIHSKEREIIEVVDFFSSLKSDPFVLRNEETLNYVRRMCKEFPEAEFHRTVMNELGCDFSYASINRNTGCWYAVMELNRNMQQLLGTSSGIQVTYTPFSDLQPRTIEAMRTQPIERRKSESLYLLHTRDIFAQKKIDDWTFRETYSVLTLPQSGDPKSTARELLDRIVAASSRNNPFERTTPVSGIEFFGRQDALKSLVTEIRSGRVCGLFGLRKTGKTSLLTELGRLFKMGDPDNSIYILRDLEVLPSSAEEKIPQLISDLGNQLQIAFRQSGMRTHELSTININSSVGELRQAIEASLRRGSGREKMLVIALDEVESLVGVDATTTDNETRVPEFFGALRSLVQENKNFNVVLSGITTAPITYATLHGRENPLFAWAKPTFVAELTRSESDKMIQALGSRMATRWTQGALRRVYELTAGQVFLTRSFSGAIASALSNDIADREITEERVSNNFRQWRRTAVGLVDGMMDTLSRFYPNELAVLQLGRELDLFDELETEYPSELSNLVSLGVLIDVQGSLRFSPWTQLGSKFRVTS